jgi:hypothetical protein
MQNTIDEGIGDFLKRVGGIAKKWLGKGGGAVQSPTTHGPSGSEGDSWHSLAARQGKPKDFNAWAARGEFAAAHKIARASAGERRAASFASAPTSALKSTSPTTSTPVSSPSSPASSPAYKKAVKSAIKNYKSSSATAAKKPSVSGKKVAGSAFKLVGAVAGAASRTVKAVKSASASKTNRAATAKSKYAKGGRP